MRLLKRALKQQGFWLGVPIIHIFLGLLGAIRIKSEKLRKTKIFKEKRSSLRENKLMEKENKTGVPDGLRARVESLSAGMDNVKVHINSDRPKELGALVYAQGTDIRIASRTRRASTP